MPEARQSRPRQLVRRGTALPGSTTLLEIDFGDADLINQERILEGPWIWSLCTIIGSDTLTHGRAGFSQAGGAW